MASCMEILKAKRELYDVVLEEVSNSTPNLKELDHWRNVEFPNELCQRHEQNELKIDKLELQKLMDWKLKKGKFRPTLKKLISQNEESDIISITKEAFSFFLEIIDTKPSREEYAKHVKKSMTILVKLRGVGPATASLLLSVLNKITKLAPPFYSDEAAEYIFQEFGDQKEIKLKYSMAEYIKWLDLFVGLNEEFKYDFTDLENGIWTITKNEYYQLEPKRQGKDDTGEIELRKEDNGKRVKNKEEEEEVDKKTALKKRKRTNK